MEDLFVFDKKELIEKYKNEGWKILGFFCSYTPEELFYYHKILPVRVFPEASENFIAAEDYFPAYICSFGRSTLNSLLTDKVDGFDGYFFASSCDTMRSLLHHCRRKYPDTFIPSMMFPHKSDNDVAADFLVKELKKLNDSIEAEFPGRVEDSLEEVVQLYKENRNLVLEVINYRMKNPGVISAKLMNQIYEYNVWIDKKEANKKLKIFIQDLKSREDKSYNGKPNIFAVGTCCGVNSILELIEDHGCNVVNDFLASGHRFFTDIPEEYDDPFEYIARRFNQKIMCPTQIMDTVERKEKTIQTILDSMKESNTQGVFFLHQKFCDPNGLFRPLLIPRLKKENLPILELELEQHINNSEQISTRLEAFMEMLDV